MEYSDEAANFGDRGSADSHRRNHKSHSIIKGFTQDKDTYTGSIVRLTWATNPNMKRIFNIFKDCLRDLDGPYGTCHCRQHSFMRGQKFDLNEQFISGWQGNYCNVLNGYFTKNCEERTAEGPNKDTMCPPNKYWNGLRKVGGRGLDALEYQCCEIEYHEPHRGDLPEHYKGKNGKYSFYHKGVNKFLGVTSKVVLERDTKSEFEEFNVEVTDAAKGFYRIGRRDVKLYCEQDDTTEIKLTLSDMTDKVS